jgi:hypothetical protein
VDLVREKTASASESLANNLAANTANGEETVHGGMMLQPGARRQSLLRNSPFAEPNSAMIGHYRRLVNIP